MFLGLFSHLQMLAGEVFDSKYWNIYHNNNLLDDAQVYDKFVNCYNLFILDCPGSCLVMFYLFCLSRFDKSGLHVWRK